ncbi:MAG: S41 family peptidase [Rhodospirillales bacterium]
MKKHAALMTLFTFLVIAPATHAAENAKNSADTYRLLHLFGDVFEQVRAKYVDKPSDQELIEAAIAGMLTSLDPHSSYLNAKNFREMQVQTRGEFGGLGIEVTMDGGLIKVVSPIDETPAHKAGVEPGDLITHLDGKPVMGLTLSEAVEKMRGKVGSDILITIRRGAKEPFDVAITRAIIKIRSVRSHLEDKIGYIRITTFNEQADKGVKKAVEQFTKDLGDKIQGIVLDLRNNPGGLLDQAIAVTDVFLDKGEIVSTRSRETNDTQRFNARKGDSAKGVPMVILVNGGSASASEIVAGALQDHGRAVVMGTKSFGKGSVQTIFPLSGHGAMRLTTALYYTPSGRSIQKVGIEPDILIDQARVEAMTAPKRSRESDLRGAIEQGNKKEQPDQPPAAKPEGGANAEEDKTKTTAQDYQLSRALDLLRGLAILSKNERPKIN